MRIATLSLLTALSMTATSAAVWAVAPGPSAPGAGVGGTRGPLVAQGDPAVDVHTSFSAGQTLRLEGRVGHAELRRGARRETYALVNVTAPTDAAGASAPLNLAIVIDRSGSMKGKRLESALEAARGMVRRLRDGDVVSVVAYDTTTELRLGATTIDSTSRERALGAIDGIVAKGDTCISCGIEAGMDQLRLRTGMVDRILLLSDGEATAGVKDLEGFRRLAEQCLRRNVAVSSIGVDVDYNERVMSLLARTSNGRHHFVENASALPRVFEAELESLVKTAANDAELTVELAPGVEVLEVFDRGFRREGSRLIVPFGSFSAGEQKTLLVRLAVPADREGDALDVARFSLSYRDLALGAQGTCSGDLGTHLLAVTQRDAPLDPLVAARLQRSTTSSALIEANQLFNSGRTEEAKKKLAASISAAESERARAVAAAPADKKEAVDRDFQRQASALGDANDAFAAEPSPAPVTAGAAPQPAAPSRKGKAQVRSNASVATDLAF